MAILRVKATGTGRKVVWSELKQGNIVDVQGITPKLSAVLTDVVADLVQFCQVLDNTSRVKMIVPNGFTRIGFNLAIVGSGLEITCARRLVRGYFPLNPMALEFGSNYDVVVSVASPSADTVSQIVDMLTSKFECLIIAG